MKIEDHIKKSRTYMETKIKVTKSLYKAWDSYNRHQIWVGKQLLKLNPWRLEMNWISVKDRLPDQPDEITTCERYWCALECGTCELVRWAHTTSGYHEWIWNDYITSSITHWMELPTAPEY